MMKLKNIALQACVLMAGSLCFSACNDFLDREPLASVTPEVYFTTTDHFAAYSVSRYNRWFTTHGGYGMGIGNGDGATDNAVSGGYSTVFEKDAWKVPQSGGGWSFGDIRYCNYFFENALPKYTSGQVSGNKTDIEHYIGEMYFMRAWIYFHYLRQFGDFPIIREVLPDDKTVLMEKAVRQPRNLVARFILEDLNQAIQHLKEWGFAGNNRINREAALLVKSRVALYEATFEHYHQGTGRVPGDAQWPGKRVHPDYTLSVNDEVDFFLTQALEAAEQVADRVQLTDNTGVADPKSISTTSGWNPYFEMFASVDLSKNSEVLLWRSYAQTGSFSITHGTPAWVQSGSNNGLLKTYIESFLMKDGLPWYAASKEVPYEGDQTLDAVKANRDDRLQLFVFSESNFLPNHSQQVAGTVQYFMPHPVSNRQEMQDKTGYRLRKYASFDPNQNVWGKAESTTGCIVFRGVEAYLNYLEAYFLKYHRVDGKAAGYWKAVRQRAGVDTYFLKTIQATDLSRETDWAKKSGSELVDATLFNIRRERRCEFIGEDMRWDDLIRWRAMDDLLTKKFVPEGCNFWDELYQVANKDENGTLVEFKHNGSAGSNISDPSCKYLRPYAIVKDNNPIYDGYTWAKANYLSPVPVREMELLSPDEQAETSVLYQNPYWPTVINGSALE